MNTFLIFFQIFDIIFKGRCNSIKCWKAAYQKS